MTLSLPWIGMGVIGALRSNSNDPRQWLPRGFDETDKYHWLQAHFGNDEPAVVSWEGCTLDNPDVEQLAEALLEAPETSYFERALTGPGVVERLVSGPLQLSRSEAIRRLQGLLIGPDGRTTCVLLTLSKRGALDRVAAIEEIRRVALKRCGLKPEQLRLGGPTVDAATIDVESQRLLLELAALSGVVAFGITLLWLRSARLAVIVLVTAVYSTGLALSILYYTGGTMNLVMTMLPPLVYVLSISAAVHMVNYYRDAVDEGAAEGAPVKAIADGWRPCLLASATTAVGMLSLAVSEIVPVMMFGIYAAAGMVASLVVVLLFLPVALTVWPVGPRDATSGATATWRSREDWVVDAIIRRHKGIVAACVVLMILSGYGLTLLRSTVKLQYRFGSTSRIIQDYRWLEKHLGPLVPMELVVHFPSKTYDFQDQLRYVAALERLIQHESAVDAALCGADFAPRFSSGRSARDVARRAVLRRKEETLEQQLRDVHFLADGENGERLWRISVRAPALADIDYGRFVDKLRKVVDPSLEQLPGVHVTYTGVIPLIYKAQRELLNDLTESFFLAFGTIALVMVVVLRNIRGGMVAMIPNVFPVVVVFGLMGWLNIWIEIGSIMTASAAMGIAVDDTFHFLTWFRGGSRRGLTRHEALRFAYRRCAGAMVRTTLICSCGLLVFSLSSFMPIVRFAWLMAILLTTALLGDLVLLPALLSSRLGKLFENGADEERENGELRGGVEAGTSPS